ncbi:MAG: methylated-DNA--[protein]-cysteine S-methyltransferase [Chitinophagaceae bacterium]|nr:MAG: methylated-DNA--[protein]-cysteine S-methyltransferase [Chitinophagaceae bacterium]
MDKTYCTYYQSPLGQLKVTGTHTCITGVTFQDDPPTEPADTGLPALVIGCVEQLIQYFNGDRQVFELPLEQDGTGFQRDVWTQLSAIPFGRTISYIQLAIRQGDPKATRAVASANGRNNIAIIVPCHRVIGANRSLTGYAGGIWRKKWLLDHEAKISYGVLSLF